MESQTIGALALRPNRNHQGGQYFHSLSSCRLIHRTHWKEIPVPDKVIARVNTFLRQSNAQKVLFLENRAGIDIDDINYHEDSDSNYKPNDNIDNYSTSSNESHSSD